MHVNQAILEAWNQFYQSNLDKFILNPQEVTAQLLSCGPGLDRQKCLAYTSKSWSLGVPFIW